MPRNHASAAGGQPRNGEGSGTGTWRILAEARFRCDPSSAPEQPGAPCPENPRPLRPGMRWVREACSVQRVDVDLLGERPTRPRARVQVLALGLLILRQRGIAVERAERGEVGEQLLVGAVDEAVPLGGV